MSDDNLESSAGIELIVATVENDEPESGAPAALEVPHETPAGSENIAAEPAAEGESIEPAEITDPIAEAPLPGDEKKGEGLPKWAEKKLSRKDAELKQKEAEAAHYRAQLEQLASQQNFTPQNTAQDHDAPKKEAYANEGDYIAAMVMHTNRRAQQVAQVQMQQKHMQDQEARFQSSMVQKYEKGKDKYDDFDDKVRPLFSAGFPENRAMAEAINDSQYTEDMLYFLGQHREEAEKIALLNPIQAVKKIAELEARFSARGRPQASKAPAPITSIQSNQAVNPSIDTVAELMKNSHKMDQAQYEAAYKKAIARNNVAW